MKGTVEEIMTKQVLTLSPDADSGDAAWGLTLSGIGGAPVRDAQGHVLGIVSKSDLADPDRVHDQHEPVRDVMTPLLFAVRTSDSLMDAIQRMVETGAHRLIVVDDQGKLAGIITPMDVLKEMLRRNQQ